MFLPSSTRGQLGGPLWECASSCDHVISEWQQRQILPSGQDRALSLWAGHQEVTVPTHVAPDPLLIIGDIEEDDRVGKPVPVQVHGGAEICFGDVGDFVNLLKSKMITSPEKQQRIYFSTRREAFFTTCGEFLL